MGNGVHLMVSVSVWLMANRVPGVVMCARNKINWHWPARSENAGMSNTSPYSFADVANGLP